MDYLQKKFYPRKDISIKINVDSKDKHFKRKVITHLTNLGYLESQYKYEVKGVTFYWSPTTNMEKLKYVVGSLGISNQINIWGFALHFYCLLSVEDYMAMPWLIRQEFLKSTFNVSVSDRTLRRWTSTFLKDGEIIKDKETYTVWCTKKINEVETIRYQVLETEDEEYQEYIDLRTRALHKTGQWEFAYNACWNRFHAYYYKCYKFDFNAWNHQEEYEELIRLVKTLLEDGNDYSK